MRHFFLSNIFTLNFFIWMIWYNSHDKNLSNYFSKHSFQYSYFEGKNRGNHSDTTIIEMKTEGIELSYSKKEINAKAGEVLLIRYTNESDMNHNIVLLKKETDIRPVGIAALQAVANDWIPENEMNRIITHSNLVYAGETTEFIFVVPPPGTYPYICTYSAHWTQMQGRLISTP